MIEEIFINWELFFFFLSHGVFFLFPADFSSCPSGTGPSWSASLLLEEHAKGAGRKKGLIYEVALEV